MIHTYNGVTLSGPSDVIQDILKKLPQQKTGPQYLSKSKGLIYVEDMHPQHRLAAAKSLLTTGVNTYLENAKQCQSLKDLQNFLNVNPRVALPKDFDNLVFYKSDSDATK